ncbi:MAG: hypothetical protein A2Y40_06700 [Candidatus Margulisbacteria bacterium GWF2_35_9]|nr:MAG: hypothetical protein A2Y40_06700 [Candidatus Margulisbacteria bacterium GWF2_35_9]
MLLGDNTIKGEGWTYVRYETLEKLGIDPDKIVSAKYNFYNLYDLGNEAVISAYAVTCDWCSINTMWFNRPTFDEKPVTSTIIKESGVYQLDITPLLKKMLENIGNKSAIYSINNSFLIKCDTANTNMIFPSGDNGLLSPYLEIVIK